MTGFQLGILFYFEKNSNQIFIALHVYDRRCSNDILNKVQLPSRLQNDQLWCRMFDIQSYPSYPAPFHMNEYPKNESD